MMHCGIVSWPRHNVGSLSHVCVRAQLLRERGVKDKDSGQQQKGLMPSASGGPEFKACALSLDMPQGHPSHVRETTQCGNDV